MASRDADEAGIAEVPVSNGSEVTLTDADGRYSLPVDEDTIVFVVKPRGWMTPVRDEDNIPQFYYIHKPAGSPKLRFAGVPPTGPLPKAVDFALYPQEEGDRFRILCMGDPQPRNIEEVDLCHA